MLGGVDFALNLFQKCGEKQKQAWEHTSLVLPQRSQKYTSRCAQAEPGQRCGCKICVQWRSMSRGFDLRVCGEARSAPD